MRQVACAILYRRGSVLLGRRSRAVRTYPDCWDVLGGHVEAGETTDEALLREVQEEAGVTPTVFSLLGTLDEPNPQINGPAVYHVYGIKSWRGSEPVMLGDEHTELRWFEVGQACELPDLALATYRPFFAQAADWVEGKSVPF